MYFIIIKNTLKNQLNNFKYFTLSTLKALTFSYKQKIELYQKEGLFKNIIFDMEREIYGFINRFS